MSIITRIINFFKGGRKMTSGNVPMFEIVRQKELIESVISANVRYYQEEPQRLDLNQYQFAKEKARQAFKLKSYQQMGVHANPRYELLKLYENIMQDLTLRSVWDNRMNAILNTPRFVYVNGKPNDKLSAKINNSSFDKLIRYIMESKLYGFSAITYKTAFQELVVVDNLMRTLVIPELQYVLVDSENKIAKTFEELESESNEKILLVCEKENRQIPLGLLSDLFPTIYYKRNVYAFWFEFAQKFGTPIRVLKTPSRDEEVKRELKRELSKMGNANYFIMNTENELELLQSSGTDAYSVYLEYIERLNKDVTIAILGQTMTTEDGSSRSQAEVHLKTLNEKQLSDQEFVKNTLEQYIIPELAFPRGAEVVFDNEVKRSLSEQWQYHKEIIQLYGIDRIDAKFVSETYGIPISEAAPEPQPLPAQAPTVQNIITYQNTVSDAYAEFARLIPMLYELAKSGGLTLETLDMLIYYTYVDIVKGIIEAYERDYTISVAYNTLEPRIAKHFKVNIYHFSNAKSFQQLLDINKAVLDPTGEFVTFEDFKQAVATINATYNDRWLKTEYEFAKAAGQMAIQWEDIQETKDALPLLKYTSVKDRLVRPAHRILDNIIRPVDDPFWEKFYPPNGWNCRCIVKQVQKGKVTPDDVLQEKIKAADIPTEFQFNPAISKVVFNPQLPVFGVPSNISATIQSRIQEFKNFKDPDIT